MRILITVALLLGCAHQPTIADAIHAVNVAAAGGDVALQAASGAWADYVDARIAICEGRRLPDQAAREACMAEGGAGPAERDQVDQALADIIQAQRDLAAALKSAAAAYETVRPMLERAEKETPDG